MFQSLKGPELLIILLIILLLFGAKKLPDTARGLGRSMRIFKAETKGLREDDEPAGQPREIATPESRPAAHGATAPDPEGTER